MIPVSGALQVVLAALLFAAMGAAVKEASETLPNTATVFFRNAFALLTLLPWIGWQGLGRFKTGVLHLHLFRSLSGLSAMYCFFFAISQLDLATAVLLNYTLPLFMPVIAWVWLDEPVAPSVRYAVAVGFVGVAFVLKPGSGVFQLAALVGLCAGLLGALAQVGIRRLTRSEPSDRIVFYFSLIATLFSAIPFLGTQVSLSSYELKLMIAAGVLAAAAQIFLTRGYASAPAARVGPFIYTSVLFAGGFDWIFWKRLPGGLSLVGAGLICLGGILSLGLSRRRIRSTLSRAKNR